MWSKNVRSAVFSRGLGDFAQRDELCEDCRSVRPDFCRCCLNSERRGEWADYGLFYCRGGNAKGDKTNGGRVHNMQAKPTQENSECRMRNLSSVLFVLTKCGCLVHFLACHKREQAVFTDTENALCFASRTQITLAMATILRRRIA